jgi:hypothetical protein
MKVISITEMEDGSAVVELDMSPDEMRSLLEYAVCMGLIEGLKLLQKQKLEELKECPASAQSTSNT